LTDGANGEARSAFFNTPQLITAFDAQFIYQSTGGADGTAFVMQNSPAGPAALSGGGGCLAICGLTPSAAVEFNLYSGVGGTGTIFVTNGTTGVYNSTLPLDLGSDDPILVTLDYDGSVLTEHLVDQNTGQTYDATNVASLPQTVGGANTAIIGFTGATGGLASVQQISSFTFTLKSPPAVAPAIIPNGGVYSNYVVVSLTSATPGSRIYYTLDGSAPTTASIFYSNAFVLTNSAMVTAIATKTNIANSLPSSAFFTVNSPFVTITSFGGAGAGWTTNGGAAISNNLLTLTDGNNGEARSAFYNLRQPITNFSSRFVYQSTGGADGTTFVVQNAPGGAATVGGGGGCLGYCGIAPSAAVEFNLYSGNGGTGTRLAISGAVPAYTSTLPLDLDSGHPISVTLNYDGSVLFEHLVDQNTGRIFNTNYVVNIPNAVGNVGIAYVGFTGATGGLASTQTITNFTFGPYIAFAGVPAPTLTAAISGNQLVISWVTSPANYVLESTSTLSPPAWNPVPQAPVPANQQTTIAIPIGSGSTFYRLHSQ
jgi:hypothetical protein